MFFFKFRHGHRYNNIDRKDFNNNLLKWRLEEILTRRGDEVNLHLFWRWKCDVCGWLDEKPGGCSCNNNEKNQPTHWIDDADKWYFFRYVVNFINDEKEIPFDDMEGWAPVFTKSPLWQLLCVYVDS